MQRLLILIFVTVLFNSCSANQELDDFKVELDELFHNCFNWLLAAELFHNEVFPRNKTTTLQGQGWTLWHRANSSYLSFKKHNLLDWRKIQENTYEIRRCQTKVWHKVLDEPTLYGLQESADQVDSAEKEAATALHTYWINFLDGLNFESRPFFNKRILDKHPELRTVFFTIFFSDLADLPAVFEDELIHAKTVKATFYSSPEDSSEARRTCLWLTSLVDNYFNKL